MADNSTDIHELTTTKIAFSVALCVIAVINITGNSLVIRIIVGSKLRKSPMNYLLLNLAVADILVGMFIPSRFLFTYYVSHPQGTTGAVICRMFTGGPPAWIGGLASNFFLVAISFERYYAVIHPFSRQLKINWLKVRYITGIAWILSLVINSPYFFLIDYIEESNFCYEVWPEGYQWLPQGYSLFWLLFGAILPTGVMIVLYSKVIFRLWIKPRRRQVEFSQIGVLKIRKRVTKMVLIVSLVYFACWTPNLLMYCLYHFDVKFEFTDTHYIIGNILVTCNSAINPFIYGFQSKYFRGHLKMLVSKNRVLPSARKEPGLPPRMNSKFAFTLDTNNLK